MSVPTWMLHKAFGYNIPQWILIFGLLLFGASALAGDWDIFVRVGLAVLILDRLFS